MSAVSWIHKFRTSTSCIASNILCALAIRLHTCQLGLLSVDHTLGLFNVMADIASRKHTTNLTKFPKTSSTKFPLPYKKPLASVPIQHKPDFADLLRTFNHDVNNEIVELTFQKRRRLFGCWRQWLSGYKLWAPLGLQYIPQDTQIKILGAYATHGRYGGISNLKLKVCTQTVAVALRL